MVTFFFALLSSSLSSELLEDSFAGFFAEFAVGCFGVTAGLFGACLGASSSSLLSEEDSSFRFFAGVGFFAEPGFTTANCFGVVGFVSSSESLSESDELSLACAGFLDGVGFATALGGAGSSSESLSESELSSLVCAGLFAGANLAAACLPFGTCTFGACTFGCGLSSSESLSELELSLVAAGFLAGVGFAAGLAGVCCLAGCLEGVALAGGASSSDEELSLDSSFLAEAFFFGRLAAPFGGTFCRVDGAVLAAFLGGSSSSLSDEELSPPFCGLAGVVVFDTAALPGVAFAAALLFAAATTGPLGVAGFFVGSASSSELSELDDSAAACGLGAGFPGVFLGGGGFAASSSSSESDELSFGFFCAERACFGVGLA